MQENRLDKLIREALKQEGTPPVITSAVEKKWFEIHGKDSKGSNEGECD